MRLRLLLVLAVETGGDVVVEGEGVQANRPSGRSEAATRSNARRRSAQVGSVQQRAERAVDQCRRLVEMEVPHVGLTEVEFHAGCDGAEAGLLEHRGGRVKADHWLSGRLRDWDHYAARQGEGNLRLPA